MKRIEKLLQKDLEEILRQAYVEQKLSVEEIANYLDISPLTIHKWLKMANIKSRGFTFDE